MFDFCKVKCPNCDSKYLIISLKKEIACPECGTKLTVIRKKEGCFFYVAGLLIVSIFFEPLFNWVIDGQFSIIIILTIIFVLIILFFIERLCMVEVKE